MTSNKNSMKNTLYQYLYSELNPTRKTKFDSKYGIPVELANGTGTMLVSPGAGGGDPNIPGKGWGSLLGGAAASHPFKTAGAIGLGLGNLGGLTDNDKFGGQLGGLALGGLGSYALGANPYTALMLTLGGGELGALFDKLRAKNEQPQYYGSK